MRVIRKKVGSIDSILTEYDSLRYQKSLIESRMKELSDSIKEFAISEGIKDDTGSYSCDSSDFIFGATARKSVSVNNPVAVQYLKDHGLESHITVTESVSSDTLEKLVSDGDVPYSDLSSLTTVKSSYAVYVKCKDMVSINESTLIAASKKRKE